jgi:hypothetical protein
MGHFKIVSIIGILILITYFIFWTYHLLDPNNKHSYKIELNKEELVFTDSNQLFAPGEQTKKPLEIKNSGNKLVYYQLFLANVRGDIQDVVMFYIYQDNQLLYSNSASQFNQNNAFQPKLAIRPGETHTYDLVVEILEDAGNEYQGKVLNFDLVVTITNNKD